MSLRVIDRRFTQMIAYFLVMNSKRCSTFFQVISFLQVKLASQKDNCKSCTPAFLEKLDRI